MNKNGTQSKKSSVLIIIEAIVVLGLAFILLHSLFVLTMCVGGQLSGIAMVAAYGLPADFIWDDAMFAEFWRAMFLPDLTLFAIIILGMTTHVILSKS